MKTWHPSTAILHSDYRPPEGFAAFPPPLHQASTVLFERMADVHGRGWHQRDGYLYGLHGTPTTFTLEARLAEIEGGAHCQLMPSGLSAIAMINLALLQSGDHLLLPANAYLPNRNQGMWLAEWMAIECELYDPLDLDDLAARIRPHTRLVWAEAPGSVTMEVPDVGAIAELAHRHGAKVALDNTWSAGLAYAGFEHGADIVMQALTKYQSGGSDLLMGAAITRDAELHRQLAVPVQRLGIGVSPQDCALVLRGLDSLPVRFAAHDAAARQLAAWLKMRPEVAKVLHPAFEDCPGHEVWRRDFSGAGGVFSIILAPGFDPLRIDLLVDSLQLFKIGFSWGGAHSLCMSYPMQTLRSDWNGQGGLVRFAVGLEHPDDLIADIAQALEVASNA